MDASLQYIDRENVPSLPAMYVAVISEKVYGNESATRFISFEIVLEFIAGPDIPTNLLVAGASIRLAAFRWIMKNI